MLIFQDNMMEKLCSHAQIEYPKECCGIMLGRRLGEQRIVHRVIQTTNMSGECRDETCFTIDPLEIAKAELLAEEEDYEIIGFYHSHPDYEAIASDTDLNYMIAGYSYPIVSVRHGNCVEVESFEKLMQTDTDAIKEKILVEEK